MDYNPFKVFTSIGLIFIIAGMVAGFKVLIYYIQTGMVTPYLPTAVLTTILGIVGFQIIIFGLLADMLKTQRQLQEEILYHLKKMKFE